MLCYFCFAIVFLLLSVYFTVRWLCRERYSGGNLLVITTLTLLSIAVLRMPLNAAQGEGAFASFLHGLISAMQTVGLDESVSDVISSGVCLIDDISETALQKMTLAGVSFCAKSYAVFVIVQYVAAVGICGFALIKTISNFLLRQQLHLRRKPVFFFSSLTKESIHLAQTIQQNMQDLNKRALFCFTSVQDGMDEEMAQAWREANLKHSFQLSEGLNASLFPWFSSSVNCILCSKHEEQNLKTLSHLLQENSEARVLRSRKMKYFIYAQSDQAEQAIDALTAKYIPGAERSRNQIICMLNHQENLVMHILDQAPLHAFAASESDGRSSKLHILVGGSTPLAIRFLRNAFSCGQMENCELSITLADPDAEAAAQRVYASAPLLKQTDLPIVQACGRLRFHTLSRPSAVADDELLRDMHYILLAYDSDDENMKAARRIRTIIERQRLTDPVRAGQKVAIIYVVKDAAMNALCQEIDPAEGYGTAEACRMIPVGSLEQMHHTEAFFGNELLIRSFLLDRAYSGTVDVNRSPDGLRALQKDFVAFMNKAYDRRSTVAAALHLSYRNSILQHSETDRQKKLALLAHAEHLRWIAFMLISGYEPPNDDQLSSYHFTGDATHRSKLLKLHPCLVPSAREITDDLWAPDTVAVDELDALSRRLHAMALEKLRAYPVTMPENPTPQDKGAIIKAAEALPNDSAQAVRLAKALFSNFKQYDMDIVSATEDILRNAGDPVIQNALRLFWLEADT